MTSDASHSQQSPSVPTPNPHQPTTTSAPVVEDSSSPACQRCVKVLRDMISGLQDDRSSSSNLATAKTSAPVTLLRAIAGGGAAAAAVNNGNDVRVEQIEDGIKIHIPVETTIPEKLKGWKEWFASDSKEEKAVARKGGRSSIFNDFRFPLALSVNDKPKKEFVDPLTIELKCRRCASEGPESGARAFLTGPNPLAIVLCHNRIHSNRAEVEEILTHELVHLYDVQNMHLDLQDCESLAYSEVRAAKAAECKDSWHPHLQLYCVRQKAICATNNLFPGEGRKCIQRVFDHAFADNRPFSSTKDARTAKQP